MYCYGIVDWIATDILAAIVLMIVVAFVLHLIRELLQVRLTIASLVYSALLYFVIACWYLGRCSPHLPYAVSY